MKKYSSLIWIYAALLIIGGTIGFIKAGSAMSLIASSLFALLLGCCGYGMLKNDKRAYPLAISALACLLAFFSYRFSLSYQMMPAGMMIIVTTLVLIPLLAGRKNFQQSARLN